MKSNFMEERVAIRLDIERCKYKHNDDLVELLILTGLEEIVEGNTRNETFWGVCNGSGSNHYGEILIHIRTELKLFRMN